MNFDFKEKSDDGERVVVTLALLDKELHEMMLQCTKNRWKFKMVNNNNLQLFIPKHSLHLLFYLGYKILSGHKFSK